MSTKTTNLDPHTIAFNKLYFVNLFAAKDNINCHDFVAAKIHYPRLAAIAEKLKPIELNYLIEKIESIQ